MIVVRFSNVELPTAETIGVLSDRARGILRHAVAPVVRLAFRPTLTGFERLPRGRPFMLVANHSAGVAIAELASIATLLDERDPNLRISAFAHVLGFQFALGRAAHGHLGTVPSTYDGARAAFDAGAALLVFPGGDYESLRPLHRVNEVDFNGRKGFLRVAQQAGVPIVPMGIRGSHWTAPILVRSPSSNRANFITEFCDTITRPAPCTARRRPGRAVGLRNRPQTPQRSRGAPG